MFSHDSKIARQSKLLFRMHHTKETGNGNRNWGTIELCSNSIRIGKLAGDQSSSIEKRDSGKKLLLYYMLLRASRICSHA